MYIQLFLLFCLVLHCSAESEEPDYESTEYDTILPPDRLNDVCWLSIEYSEETTTTEVPRSETTTSLENASATSTQLLSSTLESSTDQDFSTMTLETTTSATINTDNTETTTPEEDPFSSVSETMHTSSVPESTENTSTDAGNTDPTTSDNKETYSIPHTSTTSQPTTTAQQWSTSSASSTSSESSNKESSTTTTSNNDLTSSETSALIEGSSTTTKDEVTGVPTSPQCQRSTTSLDQESGFTTARQTAMSDTETTSIPILEQKSTETGTSESTPMGDSSAGYWTLEDENVWSSMGYTETTKETKETVGPTQPESTQSDGHLETSTPQEEDQYTSKVTLTTSEPKTTKTAETSTKTDNKQIESPDVSTSTQKAAKTSTPTDKTTKTTSQSSKPTTTKKIPSEASVSSTEKKSSTKKSTTKSTAKSTPKTNTARQTTGKKTRTTARAAGSKKTVQTRKTGTPLTRFTKKPSTTAEQPTTQYSSKVVPQSSTIDPACLLACPPGWSYAAGKCFMMVTNGTKISYSVCLANCEAVGGTLVGFFELTNPSVRSLLQVITSDVFNTSIVFSNAYKSNVLRVQNYLYTHNLSMNPQETGSSWTSKRIDQPKNHSIVNWCMKPAFCREFNCPLFEIVHLSQGIYQTDHLNAMAEVQEGTIVKLKCVETNADQVEWETTCGKRGYWVPHPTYGQCTRSWGLARTIVDRPGYTKIVENCNICHPVGTLSCEEVEGGFQCLCKALYEGHHCELTPRWCEQWPKSKDPCGEYGECTENIHEWYCKCHNENRTGALCEYDRTANNFNPFGSDENVRKYFSPAMVSHLAIGGIWFLSWHMWKMLRIEEAKRANDRVDWLQSMRYSAVGVRSLLVSMAGNPSVTNLDSPGRFCAWVAWTWTSIAILFWHLAEAHSLLLLVRGVHLNSLRDVDGKPAMKLLMGYFVTPILMMVIWFASVHASWDKLITFATNWSTLGSMEDPSFFEVCYMIPVLAVAIQLATIGLTIMAEAERRGPNHALNRNMCCFHYWKPKRTEVMDKAFRSSIPNIVCSLLVMIHTVASAFSFDRPDRKKYETMTSVSGMILSACYFLHTRVLCYSEAWAVVVEMSMVYLPKKWSPRIQPLSLFTREEVLMKRAPKRLEKEKRKEEEKREKEWQAAVEADEERRAAWLKRWPDCPPQLVPHVRLQGPEKIETDTSWPFSPSVKDYFCEEERHQVFMNLAAAYFRDRMKRRHAPESSAFIAARELFGSQLHPRPQHMVEKQLKQFYKELSELAEKDDWMILGRDKQDMASFKKWDDMFYSGLEKLYRSFPHHDPRPHLYKDAMKLMEKSSTMWFYPYVDDLPTNIIIPTQYPLWTKWETFIEPFTISTEDQLNEAIAEEFASLSKHNERWDWIYDNDPWVLALDPETREKLKIQMEVDIKDGTEHENPRLLPMDIVNDRLWDERRPGFIGPRRRMTRPTFNLWELSLEREYLEEERRESWKALEKRSFRAHLDAGLTEERRNPRFVKFWVFNNQPPPPLHEQRIKYQPHIDRTPF